MKNNDLYNINNLLQEEHHEPGQGKREGKQKGRE
jgi:hypothetical protein